MAWHRNVQGFDYDEDFEVLGDAVPDEMLIEAVLKNKFDVQKPLSGVLDYMQNLKDENEGTVSTGKTTKGKESYFPLLKFQLIMFKVLILSQQIIWIIVANPLIFLAR
uniref:Uncharacterized protein n=1 Tax=Theropithecus gelada TaxID=9565 RepID=A0A8D2FXL6_THEGE